LGVINGVPELRDENMVPLTVNLNTGEEVGRRQVGRNEIEEFRYIDGS
jgi:hypothetical protein